MNLSTMQFALIPSLNRYDTMITMDNVSRQSIADEDQFVAELHQLGITYLSNRLITPLKSIRSPEYILADAIDQPSSRVRTAVIALLLLHPDYAEYVPIALGLLNENQRHLLKLFYTAAVHSQREYQSDLIAIIGSEHVWLPDVFGEELGISSALSSQDAIQQLGIKHQKITHSLTNWSGTYKNVVHHLIRYKRRETQWNQLPQKPLPNS
jgi:hypothetical protein